MGIELVDLAGEGVVLTLRAQAWRVVLLLDSTAHSLVHILLVIYLRTTHSLNLIHFVIKVCFGSGEVRRDLLGVPGPLLISSSDPSIRPHPRNVLLGSCECFSILANSGLTMRF